VREILARRNTGYERRLRRRSRDAGARLDRAADQRGLFMVMRSATPRRRKRGATAAAWPDSLFGRTMFPGAPGSSCVRAGAVAIVQSPLRRRSS